MKIPKRKSWTRDFRKLLNILAEKYFTHITYSMAHNYTHERTQQRCCIVICDIISNFLVLKKLPEIFVMVR